MDLPNWVHNLLAALFLVIVVAMAKGTGWICRRWFPRRVAIVLAIVAGIALGIGGGAVSIGLVFGASKIGFFLPLAATFFSIICVVEAGCAAAGVQGKSKIRSGGN